MEIVGHDPIRAMGARYPEEFDFEAVGELVNLDSLALQDVVRLPVQVLRQAVGLLATGVIDQAVGLDRADEGQLECVDEDHHVLGRVPGVHEHRLGWQGLLGQGSCEHLAHMVELALAVPLGVVQTVVDDPVLPVVGVDVQAVDHPDALDQAMSVATVLQPHQIDMMGMILVDDGVIENQTTTGRCDHIGLDVLPNQARRQFVTTQHAIDSIVTESAAVFCEIRHGEIGMAGAKKLAII